MTGKQEGRRKAAFLFVGIAAKGRSHNHFMR